jgi:hypothetical protein
VKDTGASAGRTRRGAATVALVVCLAVAALSSWGGAAAPSDRYRPPDGWRDPPEDARRVGEPDRGADEAPNVILIAFSGRCAITSCTPPDENEDALARALVPAAVAAWSAAGLRVEAWTYRAHVHDDPGRGRGYASARSDLQNAVQDGILGPDATTRVVLLGYSHGTQFAHLLAFEHPEVRFAASVLLDSICLGWDADHAADLVAALAPGAGPWAADGPYHVGCDVLSVPGLVGHLDLGDVVPWNVDRSLEVRTGGQVLGAVRDVRTNVRPDGSRVGLDRIDLADARHQEADEVGGAAFDAWVGWVLEALDPY